MVVKGVNVMNLFENLKMPLKRVDLIQVSPSTFEQIKQRLNLNQSYEEIQSYFNDVGFNINNLYHSPIGLYTFWYIDGFVFVPIPKLDRKYIKALKEKHLVEQNKKILEECWETGEYERFFSMIDSQFSFDVFFELLNKIPESERYTNFVRLYVRNEYGFKNLDKEKVRQLFMLNTDKSFIQQLPIDKDGYVTIYRGMQDKSTPVEEAYSWTLDYEVAKYFATRYNSLKSKIVKAKVKAEDIVDVLDFGLIGDRCEKEVLVLPEKVKDIQDLSFYNFDEAMLRELDKAGITVIYQYYAHHFLKRKWFHKPDGVHGLRHIKRVLLLSLIMSYLDKLSAEDRQILIYASLYHDIGREHDWEDTEHGWKSVLKRRKLKLSTKRLNEEEVKIMEFLMKYHCIRDKEGLEAIQYEDAIQDKKRAINLLKRFKDCDGLDRVRLGDFDSKYLRTETGKRLEIVAVQLLMNIE